jgi:hypothetical protein
VEPHRSELNSVVYYIGNWERNKILHRLFDSMNQLFGVLFAEKRAAFIWIHRIRIRMEVRLTNLDRSPSAWNSSWWAMSWPYVGRWVGPAFRTFDRSKRTQVFGRMPTWGLSGFRLSIPCLVRKLFLVLLKSGIERAWHPFFFAQVFGFWNDFRFLVNHRND